MDPVVPGRPGNSVMGERFGYTIFRVSRNLVSDYAADQQGSHESVLMTFDIF
jgi:hypothetical protein